MNTLPSPSRSICVQSLHLFTIIINQTTLKDDLSLIICQLTQTYIELLQSIPFNSMSLDHVCFFFNRRTTTCCFSKDTSSLSRMATSLTRHP